MNIIWREEDNLCDIQAEMDMENMIQCTSSLFAADGNTCPWPHPLCKVSNVRVKLPCSLMWACLDTAATFSGEDYSGRCAPTHGCWSQGWRWCLPAIETKFGCYCYGQNFFLRWVWNRVLVLCRVGNQEGWCPQQGRAWCMSFWLQHLQVQLPK